jgi:hypothetical protein
MNKAGSCTATGKESGKMASKDRHFLTNRSSTVLRFSAPRTAQVQLAQALRLARGQRRSAMHAAGALAAPRPDSRGPQKLKTTGRALPVVLEV